MMKDSGESEVEAAMECLVALTAQQARTTSVTETRPSSEQGLIEVSLSDIIPGISKGTSDESLVPGVKSWLLWRVPPLPLRLGLFVLRYQS